ncbi:MAG: ABC transporter permease [Alphaproteobacteria bacterium]
MVNNIWFYSSWSLYKKEVKRFIKVYNQTLIAPVIISLIYLAIFYLAAGQHVGYIKGIKFSEFIAAGLIIMSALQNAFSNTSSSIIMGKISGTIIDYLIPPFSSLGLCLALAFSGATRGIFVGILVAFTLNFFIPIQVYSLSYCIFYLIAGSLMLSLLGIITSIISENFEQMSAVTTYIITPFSFLSGTFYSTDSLPIWANYVNNFNPFFYIIDGFRYGLIGINDSSLQLGTLVTTIFTISLFSTVYIILNKGWNIRS